MRPKKKPPPRPRGPKPNSRLTRPRNGVIWAAVITAVGVMLNTTVQKLFDLVILKEQAKAHPVYIVPTPGSDLTPEVPRQGTGSRTRWRDYSATSPRNSTARSWRFRVARPLMLVQPRAR